VSDRRVLDALLLDACVGCGCRDELACAGGCSWAIPYLLCTRCAQDLDAAITAWADRAADAIARLTWWRNGNAEGDGLEGVLQAALREALVAIALPDSPILTVPDPEGGPSPQPPSSDVLKDLNTTPAAGPDPADDPRPAQILPGRP
jgi:hypothetical protein